MTLDSEQQRSVILGALDGAWQQGVPRLADDVFGKPAAGEVLRALTVHLNAVAEVRAAVEAATVEAAALAAGAPTTAEDVGAALGR